MTPDEAFRAHRPDLKAAARAGCAVAQAELDRRSEKRGLKQKARAMEGIDRAWSDAVPCPGGCGADATLETDVDEVRVGFCPMCAEAERAFNAKVAA